MNYKNLTTLALDGLLDFLTRKFDGEGTVVVCQSDKLLDRFSTTAYRVESVIACGPIDGAYTIYLRKDNKKPERIICHEFIHLMQMLRGDLVVDEKVPKFTWKGQDYDPSFPYRFRPWEKEAFSRQNFWYNEYKKSIKH